MEKYSRFATLTNEFLHGVLQKLEVEYNDNNSVTLNIFYTDNNEYHFDYHIEVDILKHMVERASHVSEGYSSGIKLHREQAFEQAVCNELFQLASQ